ncbi:MAG TPA: hypothetical protein VGK36_14095 [Candidatus Angelobacter sp.]
MKPQDRSYWNALSRFGAQTRFRAASPTCAASCLPREQKFVGQATFSSGLERSDTIEATTVSSEPGCAASSLPSGAEE